MAMEDHRQVVRILLVVQPSNVGLIVLGDSILIYHVVYKILN